MYRIVVMGDSGSVMGFRALGLEVCPADTAEEGRAALHRLSKENVGIIYMTEQLAAVLGPVIERCRAALTPAVILIPGKEGSLGIGMEQVKTTAERAVGADMI